MGKSLILNPVMRDVIWTFIVIWLIYKLVDVFKAVTAKRTVSANSDPRRETRQSSGHSASHSQKDMKSALQKHLNKEGEYVDFEEVK